AQKYIPLRIVPKSAVNKAKNKSSSGLLGGSKGVNPKELQVFTRQFSVLVGAGIPIVDSIDAMIGPGKTPVMNATLKSVVNDIEKGKRLADALSVHSKVFDKMYVNLVKAGEEGGVLDEVLQRLAAYIEKSVKLKGKIKGAMFYPVAVIIIAILVIIGILVFVVPNFVKMFQDAGKELPALTQMVVDSSNFVLSRWYIVIGACVAIPYAFKMYISTAEGKINFDKIMINVPLFGSLIQKGAIARFSRTLSTLLSAGVRIIDSLDIAASTAGNYVVEQNILDAKESISKGKSIADPFKKSKYIPDMVTQMIAVGEQTGALDTMLSKIADFYEDEVETAADALTSLIEPLLMVFLGGIIAVLVIAMYLPIFDLASSVG
ncbi:MAG: type II secretion system F family protein, partial [Bdellovibrionales bacterium]|nr:type II secretion system F family protein [Bdellovibrionales bacterium]